MNQPNQSSRAARMLRGLALISPACLLTAAALNLGGCEHEREVRVERVHDRIYEEPAPPPPPPVVEETVVEEPVYTPPPTEVVTVYERDLNPYGHWVEVEHYGRCWVPNERPSGWRPYTCGHWVSSDQGWVWVAEDQDAQFGEVCYHYGRWYEDRSVGWCWVPGRVWGPSWCAWREGGGYCAWAPLPPQCVDGAVVDVTVVNRYVPPDRYYVCEERYITEPRVDRRVIVNNVTIVNRTTNITNITYVNNRVVNRGVSVKNVEHFSGHTVARVQVAKVSTADEARKMVASGRPVVYSPPEIEHYGKEHPVRVVQPAHRVQNNQPNNARVDQKTAEQLRAEQQQRGGPNNPLEKTPAQLQAEQDHRVRPKPLDQKTPAQLQAEQDHRVRPNPSEQKTQEQLRAERDAEAQRVRNQNQRVNENVPHDQKPQVDQKAAEEARLKALHEQKAAQERAADEKAAVARAAHEKELQERAAEEKAAIQREKAQRDAQAQQLRNEKRAEERAAQEKAASEKAAAERAAQQRAEEEKLARERAAAEKAARDKAAQNKNGQKPGDPNNPNNPNNPPR